MAELFVVATPIGNKADISLRAIEVLKNADIIACEDTRTSAKLLDAYEIGAKLVSYHKFNEKQRVNEFMREVEAGKKIALISDAGTPCISDPGRVLVEELFNAGVKITPIPGASAITTLLSAAPRNTEEFAFTAFLPRVKSQQAKVFEKFTHTDLVFYESANRLLETLENIAVSRGYDAKITVGRELTKMFEEIKYGSVKEITDYFKNHTLKGEIACLLYGQPEAEDGEDETETIEKIKKLKALKMTDKDISAAIAALYGLNKNRVYKLALQLK